MVANILDGKALAKSIRQQIKVDVDRRLQEGLQAPGLAVILVGNDPASQVYVEHKQRACKKAGFFSVVHHVSADSSQDEIAGLIEQLNQDTQVDGILLQLPLPEHIDTQTLIECIHPSKDVDGFHPYNLGRLAQRSPLLRPCTPHGIIKLLKQTGVNLAGLDAVVVGASNIVGRPMALELLLAKCTPTVCHRFSRDIASHTVRADILIVAVGKQGIIQPEMIKPGAIVIDVGITRLEDGNIVGDIDFEGASKVASWITPVPGGVGPMTVTTLLQNTLFAATKRYVSA